MVRDEDDRRLYYSNELEPSSTCNFFRCVIVEFSCLICVPRGHVDRLEILRPEHYQPPPGERVGSPPFFAVLKVKKSWSE